MIKRINFSLLMALLGSSMLATTYPVQAEFTSPKSWARGSINTSYQHWNFFQSLADNAPDVGSINPNGTALLSETSGLSVATGSGNIYGAAGAVDFVVTIPEQDVPSYDLTALVQIKTIGTELDLTSLALNSLAPVLHHEISRAPFQPFGGFVVEHQFLFNISYANYGDGVGPDKTNLTLNFSAEESMMSLDQVAIDVAIRSSGFFPERIPEPSSALLGLLASTGILGRRCDRRFGVAG